MSRMRCARAVIAAALVGSALLVPAAASPAGDANLPIPNGFYFGKMKYDTKKASIGGAQVAISKGTIVMSALSTYEQANGFQVFGDLVMTFHGTSEVKQQGIEASGEFDIFGQFEVSGTDDDVWADGAYRMKGVIVVGGVDVPYDHVFAVSGPIVPATATCKKVTGKFLAGPGGEVSYPWTMKRTLSPSCK
jgi:hypothetical protein